MPDELKSWTVDEIIELGVFGDMSKQAIHDRLRRKVWPGHKPGRKWIITPDDLNEILTLTKSEARQSLPDPAGLTKTSRRRLEASKYGKTA